MSTLTFQGVEIKPVVRERQTWMRLSQIELALGYASKGRALAKIFTVHADEFTKSMTRVLKMKTAGGMQPVRIFSLRGAHLLAMFARTDVAKAFRVWVLDLIDAEIKRHAPAGPALVAPAQVAALGEIVKRRIAERVATIPDPMNRVVAMKAAFKNAGAAIEAKFHVKEIEHVRADQFPALRDFLESFTVSWELMDDVPAAPEKYDFPLSTAEPHDRDKSFGNECLSAATLLDKRNRKPELELMDALAKDGYDVTGARLRIEALHLAVEFGEMSRRRMQKWEMQLKDLMQEVASHQREQGMNVLFSRPPNLNDALERIAFAHQIGAGAKV
jgi:prophage antirepressor-like protein